MKHPRHIAACLAAAAFSAMTFAQAQPDATEAAAPESTSTPIAFVYVSNYKSLSGENFTSNVYAYTAASNGKLTPVSGSPLSDSIYDMANNGTYLFGVEGDATTIASYKMGSKGSLTKVESINTATYNPGGCGGTGTIKVDHSGGFLYNATQDPDCFGAHFQFFDINKSNGKLAYVGDTDELETGASEIDFLGNNNFAYSPVCTLYDHEEIALTLGFKRHSSGELTDVDPDVTKPTPRESENNYCPTVYATDPTDHVAALLSDQDTDGDAYSTQVIGTYTASSSGKLTTTSTYKNMPTAPTAGVFGGSMTMSPSGKLLAVGGQGGLEIFHFNGSSPVTKYKTIFTNEQVTATYWDKGNHLYVIGGNTENHGKLWVYTVTPTSITEASGSPYSIPNPISIIVQNK